MGIADGFANRFAKTLKLRFHMHQRRYAQLLAWLPGEYSFFLSVLDAIKNVSLACFRTQNIRKLIKKIL